MTTPLSDGSARVLIVEESGSGRQLLSDVVRDLGFPEVVVVSSGRDALGVLEVESADWVLMPMLQSQPVNALHLLKTIADNPSLRDVRVSLICEMGDEPYIDAAFALGLMSYHPKTYLREELAAELFRLIQTLKSTGWRPVLTAGEYLRQRFVKLKRFDLLVRLEQSLLELFPGASSLLLKLGEAQLLAGERQAGIATLRQAGIIDERAKGVGRGIAQRILNTNVTLSASAAEAPLNMLNALNVETCVIVDPDTAVLATVQSWLREVGVPNIKAFEDGEAAWAWIESAPEPGLILQEWRLPGLTGPLLLQRVRQHGYVNVPILVMSSTIRPKELHLLREMGVDNVIPKPFGQQLFFKSLIWTMQQNTNPTEQRTLERKMRAQLEQGQVGEAERLRRVYMADKRIPIGAKRQIDAEFTFRAGSFRKARDLAIEALKLSGDSLLLLNLIGKALLKLGDHAAALKFFEKAAALSPMNIEHLCNMAVTQFELGAHANAEQLLTQAKAIDDGNLMVQETACEHAIVGGDREKARALMGELKSVKNVVAYMNNRAVALTRGGRYDEGIALYNQTKEALPDNAVDVSDAVSYNLGLAYARYGDLDKAVLELKGIVGRAEAPLHKKATSLSRRIEHVTARGLPLSLYSDDERGEGRDGDAGEENADSLDEETFSAEMTALLEGRRGELCLKGMMDGELLDPQAMKLIDNAPRYKARSALERPRTRQHKAGTE